ncbi:putative F-box protein At3g10240 [Rhododendron vialii]|uniref:putative F-box protein At3g10240 n=1 Tax=Rhododendron vialii TaxID=182163 RepID=UPI00265EEBCA|nr:putative F-box protein At3g10240 [Rhododendron vialii]
MAIVEELPQDVLIDILSRLPAKSLVRFKSVSKHWYSLLLNPNFISLHRTRAPLCYCASRIVGNYPYRWQMHLLPDRTSIRDLDLSFTGPHLADSSLYRGSCDGLMCLSEKSNIVICNPATRECRPLPQPPYRTWHTRYVGFAYDSKTSDYKVVRVATFRKTTLVDNRIQIYGMSADSWKETDAVVPNRDFTTYYHLCTSLDGIFYWLSYDSSTRVRAIDALNTVEGSFERISLPAGIRSDGHLHLCLMDDSISVVVPKYDDQRGETLFDVWLMDEYGLKGVWNKKYTIGPLLGSHIPFGFCPNREVLLSVCKNGKIVSYNHSTHYIEEYKQLCDLPEPRFITHVFPYSESLVSVKRRVDLA